MENKTQVVMRSMLGNYKVGQYFGSDAKKKVLNDLMEKHGVTTGLDKMKGYKREAFLKDVERSRMDYYGKKAILEHYGPQKAAEQKSLPNRNSSYDEIMAKRKAPAEIKSRGGIFGALFGSNKKIMEAEHKNLIAHAEVKNADNYHDNQSADNYNENQYADNYKQDSMDLIKRIQS